ncbi:MAG TPA: hypothetical protein P5310_03675 [bacterium]|nr:hypothetical protein [bacterium]
MDRVERSKEKLKQLIGDATYDSIRNAPQDQKHIQEYLSAHFVLVTFTHVVDLI